MITFSQTHVIRLLVLGMLLILAATSGAQQRANVRDDIDPGFFKRQLLAAPHISYFLRHQRCGRRCRCAETAAGE
jgi:hypothetical protein